MQKTNSIPISFLENTNMINTATNFFNSNKDISDINSLYDKTTNGFSAFNTNNNYNNYKLNTLNINKKEYNKLSKEKHFLWKEINNLNYNEFDNDDKILENPVIKNILNSDINENEIQNLPENYLVNLIHTLQNLANNAIKNKNNLELENKQLYRDLESIKTNNEYLHQKNIKINQKLIKLNREKNEEKKTQNLMYNLLEGNDTYIKRKKYYCHICTNKKFKSQKYLDEHILRRHPDYSRKNSKEKNKKENKVNIELYTKKINDMKNYFDTLINKSIKKIQYIKINEKINSLQNLYEMSKYYNYNINNNINMINSSYQEETNLIQENNNEINNNNINNIIKEEKEKEKKNETENSNNNNTNNTLEKSEESSKKKQNEIIEKIKGNFFHNYLLLKKKMRFIEIKENFYSSAEEQTTQQRSTKKRKTQKNRSKLVPDSTEDEENKKEVNNEEEKKETNEETNLLKAKKEENNDLKETKKEEANNEGKNYKKEKEIDNNYNNKEEESVKSSEKKVDLKLNEGNMINFSDEEKEKSQKLKQFCLDFKNRDSNLSKLQERYYFKKVTPKDFNLDKNKVDNIIKEKIDNKLNKYNTEEKTIQEMRAEMMRIYYKTSDYKDEYGDRYLYFYVNISNFINLQDLILEANNNNIFLEESFFEKISVKFEEQNTSEFNNDFDNENENKEGEPFSFKRD